MTRPSVAPANPEGIVSLSPARGALPWEKRVVSAKPNGVVARWRSGDTTLGLKIARTPTLGSLADSVAGLEDTISLGLQNHPSFRRSVRQWPRTEYPKGIGSNPSGIGPGGLPHAVPQRIAGWGQRDSDLQYCYLSDPEGRERRLKPALDDRGARARLRSRARSRSRLRARSLGVEAPDQEVCPRLLPKVRIAGPAPRAGIDRASHPPLFAACIACATCSTASMCRWRCFSSVAFQGVCKNPSSRPVFRLRRQSAASATKFVEL